MPYDPNADFYAQNPVVVDPYGQAQPPYSSGNGGFGGAQALPAAAGAPPPVSDASVIKGLQALGYTTSDALDLFTNNPDAALAIVQGGIRPQGGSYANGGAGAGTDNTVGLANVGLGYAQLGQDQAQFQASQAQQDAQFQQNYSEGVRQFNATFDRNNFTSDRDFQAAQDQFAQNFAENQRQFDLGNTNAVRSLDLQTELGRGGLAVDQGNLAVNQGQLGLNTELGRGRLALDTELGRGGLANDTTRATNDTSRVAIERAQQLLNDRLGTGRLNLDTELGRGNLGVSQQGEQRLQRAQVASERLSNRDQELQRSQYVTDVLRNPSDFLARAFMQRGGTSPTGMVNQADIINNLKSSINQFAQGGYTRDPMFTTGEQGGAQSTEMIYNPTNAPIGVMNPPQTQQMLGRLNMSSTGGQWQQNNQSNTGQMNYQPIAQGGYPQGGGMAGNQWLQGLLAHLQNMPGAGGVAAGIGRLQTGSMTGVPGYANGTFPDGVQYSMPSMPQQAPASQNANNWYDPNAMQPGSTPNWGQAYAATNQTIKPISYPDVTQQGLVDLGNSVLPPAVAAALHGNAGAIPSARPVANLTLGRLSRLAPGELQALNTQLGVQYNTDLQNEMALLQERFGPQVARARGRLLIN